MTKTLPRTIKMYNKLGLAKYESPAVLTSNAAEWLIVTLSPTGDIITISDAGAAPAEEPPAAPDSLLPNNTITGILIREGGDTGGTFILVRHLPDNMSVAGTFFPADGYAKLYTDGSRIFLEASGRHAHSIGEHNGAPVLHDCPLPAPGDTKALAWHFDAHNV